MDYVVINAIDVPLEQHDALAERFAGRAGMVEHADGFVDFRLLRPTDGRTTFLVMTTWRDEAAFQAWRASPAFGGGGHGTGSGAGGAHGGEGGAAQPPPLAGSSQIWSFTVAQQTQP